jgi:hypothetical protein
MRYLTMRVIIKPAGIIIILLAFTFLSFLTLMRNPSGQPNSASAAPANAVNPSAPKGAPNSLPPSAPLATLLNTGFESDYRATLPYDTKATMSGPTAAPWADDSSWARVNVTYAQDRQNPHSGQSSQRVEVKSVTRATGEDRDVVQFSQPVMLAAGKTYKGGFWLRSDREREVEIALRQAKWPFRYYGAKVVRIGTNWTQAEVQAPLPEKMETFLMVKVWEPGTVWLDDATLTEVITK